MRVAANGIAIEVDVLGPPGGDPLLLVMGLGMQLTAWPDGLLQRLVARGFRVVRFDNRDAGLSQGFDALGVPNLAGVWLRHAMHLPVPAPYALADMARDAAGVLDALGIARAHICGASMGGMIAPHLAALAPGRVKSLTLMMTTSGARHLPQPGARVQRALLARPASSAEDDVVARQTRLWALIGSPAYAPSPGELQQHIRAAVRRAWRPQGALRQFVAVVADGDRTPLLRSLAVPTHVIHGSADPLVPVEAGRELVRLVPQATGDFIDGMGHDLPDALLERFAAGIAGVAARATPG